MRRRDFLLHAGAVALGPPAAQAQTPDRHRRIAFVHSSIPANQLIESGGMQVPLPSHKRAAFPSSPTEPNGAGYDRLGA